MIMIERPAAFGRLLSELLRRPFSVDDPGVSAAIDSVAATGPIVRPLTRLPA
jgi:hypothetical protein